MVTRVNIAQETSVGSTSIHHINMAWSVIVILHFIIFKHQPLQTKTVGQYDIYRVLRYEPVDIVLVVLSLKQLNIATFVQMCVPPIW